MKWTSYEVTDNHAWSPWKGACLAARLTLTNNVRRRETWTTCCNHFHPCPCPIKSHSHFFSRVSPSLCTLINIVLTVKNRFLSLLSLLSLYAASEISQAWQWSSSCELSSDQQVSIRQNGLNFLKPKSPTPVNTSSKATS